MMNSKVKQFLSKEARLKSAFHAIHADMMVLESGQKSLKTNVDEWIVHLDRENKILRDEISEMKAKLNRLQSLVERRELKELSILDL